MFRNLLFGAGLIVFSGAASAQTTVLTETFDSGVIPPAGWSEANNGISAGWEPDFTGLKAWHDDYNGANDNSLIGPSMDASGVTEMYMHLLHDQAFATWRDQNLIEVSLDGGLTFSTVYSETGATSSDGIVLDVDFSAYAAQPDVQVAFRYIGDYANEWDLVDLVIDDVSPGPPPAHWPHLPSSFVSANAYRENFDTLGGVLPGHMAVNMLDSTTRLDHAEGWCNIGQMAACLDPYDGNSNLEMGGNPANISYPQISNALVIGLNGAGVTDFTMSFQAMEHGEELNDDDGVFVSSDGVTWAAALTDWKLNAGYLTWDLATCDLASAGVDLSGDFYLAIAQDDNFPFMDLDGLSVDNVTVGTPVYTIANLVAGGTANLAVSGVAPGSNLVLVYSLVPGPIATGFGFADVGNPFKKIGTFTPDRNGNVGAFLRVPTGALGVTAWSQGLEIQAGVGRFTNGLKVVVQ